MEDDASGRPDEVGRDGERIMSRDQLAGFLGKRVQLVFGLGGVEQCRGVVVRDAGGTYGIRDSDGNVWEIVQGMADSLHFLDTAEKS